MLSTPKAKRDLFLATSLCDGLEDSDIKQITTLLNKNANPNIVIPTYGISPFHLVIGNNSETFAEEVTKLFLRHGGNPNVRSSDGITPVHVAAAWGRVGTLELLLANGGDPLLLDEDGCSPFHYAFDGKYFKVIAVLGKYCENFTDDNETPKYKIALDKILINNGDVMAEYIASENSEMDTKDTFSKNVVPSPGRNEICSLVTSRNNAVENYSKHTDIRSRKNNQFGNLSRSANRSGTENIILSTEFNAKFENLHLKEDLDKENIPIDDATNDTSVSFNSNSTTERSLYTNDSAYAEESLETTSRTESRKRFRRLTKTRLIPQRNFDTSILSKSPNCNLPLSARKKQNNLKSSKIPNSHSPKNFQNICRQVSVTPCRTKENNVLKHNIKKQSIQSTPRRRIKNPYMNHRNIRDLDYSFEFNVAGNNVEKKVFNMKRNLTSKEMHNDPSKAPCNRRIYSPDLEKSPLTQNKKYHSNNLVMKLHENKYDEDVDEKEYNSSSFTRGSLDFSSSFEADTRDDCNVQLTKDINNIKKEMSAYINHYDYEKPLENINPLDYTELNLKKIKHSMPQAECAEQSTNLIKNKMITLQPENNIGNRKEIKLESVSQNFLNYSPSKEFLENGEGRYKDFNNYYENEQLSINSKDDKSKETSPEKNLSVSDVKREDSPSEGSTTTYFSVQEEYKYEDVEKGIVLLERRLCVTPSVSEVDDCLESGSTKISRSPSVSSQASSLMIPSELLLLDDHTLREKLTDLGHKPGPITDTTRHVYLKRLVRLKRSEKSEKITCNYNKNIKSSLLFGEWIKDLLKYKSLEETTFQEFAKPDPSRRWREGTAKQSFNYLLLDSRVTQDLPRRTDLTESEKWEIFLSAIFYVGKGKRSRPYSHLYDAFNAWVSKDDDVFVQKIKRIIDIWNDGYGVICLHVFQNTIPVEAYTREAAMIDALGIDHLANSQSGQYYGIAATWNTKEKFALGRYLLYRAMQILMHEGERQLFPEHL